MSGSEEDINCSTKNWLINEKWLQTLLKKQHAILDTSNILISDCKVQPGCETGESVLSDIIAVTIKYYLNGGTCQENLKLEFIIKLLPQDPFTRFFVMEAQFNLREIKFYTQMIPDLEEFKNRHLQSDSKQDIKITVPKCYYGHHLIESAAYSKVPHSVLVLENIKLKGFNSANFSNGLTLRQTKASMDSIAQLHALSLSYKIKENKNIMEMYPFLFQTTKASESYQQLVERGLPQLLKFLESRPELENILTALNVLKPHTKNIIENLLTPIEPIALVTHTDFWCNNLMFREDETSCVCTIFDWQMVTYSKPTNDLALLLLSSLPADLRRLHTNKMLDDYWDSFVATCNLLKLNVEEEIKYNRKKLGEDYKKSQLLALLLCIGSVDLALGNKLMEERLLEVLRDLHKDGLLNVNISHE